MLPGPPVRSKKIILVNTLTSDFGLTLGPGESSIPLVELLDIRAHVELHKLRATARAVVVSSRTVLSDNPRLTLRHGISGRHPDKIVVSHSSATPLPTESAIFNHLPVPVLMKIDSFDELFDRLPDGTVIIEGGALLTGYFVARALADEIVLAMADSTSGSGTLRFASGSELSRLYAIKSVAHYGSSRVLRYRRR